jgi:hypothetical protein
MSSKKSFKDTPKILLSNTLPTLIVLSKPLKKIQRNLARIIYIYIYILPTVLVLAVKNAG